MDNPKASADQRLTDKNRELEAANKTIAELTEQLRIAREQLAKAMEAFKRMQ